MNRYQLYGVVLESEVPLTAPLPTATDSPDIRISRLAEPPEAKGERLSSLPPGSETPLIELRRTGDVYRLHIEGAGVYAISREGISYWPVDRGPRAEIHLIGIAMAIWLELAGVLALHGSGVVVDGRAIGLLGGNRSGKSSLALHLMGLGATLLSDDLLAIRQQGGSIEAAPAYPQVRLWPQEAEGLVGTAQGFERAHPDFDKLRIPLSAVNLGEFAEGAVPLEALYVLDDPTGSGEGGLSLQQAVIEMTRHSFAASFLSALGVQQSRLARLASLARSVPVRWIAPDRAGATLQKLAEVVLNDRRGR